MLGIITQAVIAFIAVSTDELFALVLFFAFAFNPSNSKKQSLWNGMNNMDVIVGHITAFTIIILISMTGLIFNQYISMRYVALLGLLPLLLGIWQLYNVCKFWYKKYSRPNKIRKPKVKPPAFNDSNCNYDILESSNLTASAQTTTNYHSTTAMDNSAKSEENSESDSDSDDDDHEIWLQRFAELLGKCCLRPPALIVLVTMLADGTEEIAVFIPLFATCADISTLFLVILTFYLLLGASIWLAYSLVQCISIGSAISRYSKNVMPLLLIGLGVDVLSQSVLWPNGTK